MIFKIEVEFNFIDSDENIDQAIRRQITNKIVEAGLEHSKSAINKMAEKSLGLIEGKMDEQLMEIMADFCNKEFQRYDDYGRKIGKKMTMMEILKAKFDEFLTDNVVRSASYGNQSRLESIIANSLEELYKNTEKDMENLVNKKAREILENLGNKHDDVLTEKLSALLKAGGYKT